MDWGNVLEEIVGSAIAGVVVMIIPAIMTWFMLRELGDLDKDKKDWWESEPGNKMNLVRYLLGRLRGRR